MAKKWKSPAGLMLVAFVDSQPIRTIAPSPPSPALGEIPTGGVQQNEGGNKRGFSPISNPPSI
jgi:hypothetical protein